LNSVRYAGGVGRVLIAAALLVAGPVALAGCSPHGEAPPPATRLVMPAAAAFAPPQEASESTPACPRRADGLEMYCSTNDDPPDFNERGALRLRSMSKGCLLKDCYTHWVGPPVPAYVPLALGTQRLTLIEPTESGTMAFYRDPYGAPSCSLSSPSNCAYTVSLRSPDGRSTELRLGEYFSRSDHLEVQDVRYDDGVVYFNEACQSYSRDAEGRCSSLVAVDAVTGVQRWRTGNLVSNGYFVVLDDHIVASYGFTSEKPRMSVIDKRTGKVTWRTNPGRSAGYMERLDGEHVLIRRTDDVQITYRLQEGRLVESTSAAAK